MKHSFWLSAFLTVASAVSMRTSHCLRLRLGCLLLLPLALAGCSLGEPQVTVRGSRIALDKGLDGKGDSTATAIVNEYRQKVVEMQAPVLGFAPEPVERMRPEGPMNNFEADVLMEYGSIYNGAPVDVAVANYGGIRNSWAAGNITVGDVYKVFPFDNCLFLMTLTGEQLTTLFRAIAHDGGQPLSGAHLVIDTEGTLVTADVQGKPIDPAAHYRIATLDYLAEGNDGMGVLAEGTDRQMFTEKTVRQLVTEKIESLTAAGKPVAPTTDGRITLIE